MVFWPRGDTLNLTLKRAGSTLSVSLKREPGSPAANAGVQPGDEIVAVAGQPLVASKGEEASQLLFGKSGDRLQVTLQRGQQDPTLELVLGSKGK